MDLTPSSLRRWIPILSSTVALLSGVGFLINWWSLRTPPPLPPVALPLRQSSLLLLAALGIGTAVLAFREPIGRTAGRLFPLWITALAGWNLVQVIGSYGRIQGHPAIFIQPVTWYLITLSIPGMWASALACGEDPANVRALRFGRIFAWLAGLSLLVGGVDASWGSVGLVAAMNWLSSTVALMIALHAIYKALVLWTVVDLLLKRPDEEVAIARSRRIHRSMIACLGLALVGTIAFQVMTPRSTFDVAIGGVWQPVFNQALIALVTLIAAVSLEDPKRSYKSSAPNHP